MQGVLTMLQVDVTWAKPYNGRAKPIERFWQTLTAMARRSEFVGAYCGNKIDNRPEEHDIKNAVDVALFERLLHEEMRSVPRPRAPWRQHGRALSPSGV